MTINNLVDFLLTDKIERYMHSMSKKPIPILVRGLEKARGRDFGFSPNQVAEIFNDIQLGDWFTGHMNYPPSRRLTLASRIGQTPLNVAGILDILFDGKTPDELTDILNRENSDKWEYFNRALRIRLSEMNIELSSSLFLKL